MMLRENSRLRSLGANVLVAAIRDCIAAPGVAAEVEKNYSNNLWWPVNVSDWRTRMLVAGWSTRVSYAHIRHYQGVVESVREMEWGRLIALSDAEVEALVRPLGLPVARLTYFRSLARYVSGIQLDSWLRREHADVIEEFAQTVEGAGYKVAQCAVLYAKGYHCGVIPIDSGMVEMLDPIVPFRLPTGAAAHEVVRQWLEPLVDVAAAAIRGIAADAGFHDLSTEGSPTWWTHLVLIYYKRLCWNRRKAEGPFRRRASASEPPWPNVPDVDSGAFPGVLIEGVDGAGKSYFADLLRAVGYQSSHSPYRAGDGLFDRYKEMILNSRLPAVMDRTFISEFVYGRVVRGESRVSLDECVELLKLLATRGFVAFHLEEDMDLLAERRPSAEDGSNRSALLKEYRAFFEKVRDVLPVYSVRPSQLAPGYMLHWFSPWQTSAAEK